MAPAVESARTCRRDSAASMKPALPPMRFERVCGVAEYPSGHGDRDAAGARRREMAARSTKACDTRVAGMPTESADLVLRVLCVSRLIQGRNAGVLPSPLRRASEQRRASANVLHFPNKRLFVPRGEAALSRGAREHTG